MNKLQLLFIFHISGDIYGYCEGGFRLFSRAVEFSSPGFYPYNPTLKFISLGFFHNRYHAITTLNSYQPWVGPLFVSKMYGGIRKEKTKKRD